MAYRIHRIRVKSPEDSISTIGGNHRLHQNSISPASLHWSILSPIAAHMQLCLPFKTYLGPPSICRPALCAASGAFPLSNPTTYSKSYSNSTLIAALPSAPQSWVSYTNSSTSLLMILTALLILIPFDTCLPLILFCSLCFCELGCSDKLKSCSPMLSKEK